MQHTDTPTARPVADVLQSAALGGLGGMSHGFFGRRGGVSDGIYADLNVGIGSSDDPARVHENRARVAASLGVAPDRLATPIQVHSPTAVVVEEPFGTERPRADAVVTRRPGLAVGVLTADCGPVLFADREAGVVAAAHAGWRGATGGVLEATLEAMERCGARRERVVAVLGPTITQANYEVDAAMAETVAAGDPGAAPFFAPGVSAEKRQFDLPGLILMRLTRAGVGSASFVGRCTYGAEADWFSYRRTTHRGEPDYGRQIAAIVLG
ncbi:peptidoglycan editing factor PgeF [Aureimonas sp. AU4]|uniref:peptidoglycan editing factor PgeF n=1 Tax=Aureimonas sp. AU4 TaxID=1638163 RepID=UPI0007848742|nr:peptidoglycan editing factor PgeF [Aureimonas sp. AU4]